MALNSRIPLLYGTVKTYLRHSQSTAGQGIAECYMCTKRGVIKRATNTYNNQSTTKPEIKRETRMKRAI